MSARIRECSCYQRVPLDAGWQLCAAGAGVLPDARALEAHAPEWLPAEVPGTVAGSLRAAGRWSLESPPRRFDAEDWWYRLRFHAQPAADGERVLLVLAGLASVAQVWLNGALLLQSANMFVQHRCEVGAQLRADNELVLCLRAVDGLLKTRRPRPRWRAPMVEQQQLRWIRTSLLGRTPGWSPPAPAVGPWRSIWLERRRVLDLPDLSLQVQVDGGTDSGIVRLSCRGAAPLGGARLQSATLSLEREGQQYRAPLQLQDGAGLQGQLQLPRAVRWWPHTHGEPALYRARLLVTAALSGEPAAQHPDGQARVSVELGEVGFRELRLRRDGGQFALEVNGCEIFCRGACWMPLDPVSLQGSAGDYERAFAQVCAAGMNMLRVSGATVYEQDEFLDLCDRHGILLWQDFMFANMDYPAEDAHFLGAVRAEVAQQLLRLQGRPAAAILCGNSEVSQQAAMAGAAREDWYPPLFERELAALAGELCPDVPYCPSSTHGGAFPHQASAGVTSYYGVGAYLRAPDDARRSQLRFASECLAFANVPEEALLEQLAAAAAHAAAAATPAAAAATASAVGARAPRVHDALWKQRVPRDLDAGWDFDDVRDHYLGELFRAQPQRLRYAEYERYLALSRVASGEVMAAAFSEWRRGGSRCRGALVWFLRDLWPGAGWGVIDASGQPKAAYYYLKRVLQPVAVLVSDEGNNGLQLHLINDHPHGVPARLELRLFRHSQSVDVPAARSLELPPRSTSSLPATDLFDGFLDLSYAFRFGPPPYDLLHVRLEHDREAGASDGRLLAETFHFPLGLPRQVEADIGLSATLRLPAAAPAAGQRALSAAASGQAQPMCECVLKVATRRFAQSVHIDAPPGCRIDDQYFHLAPGGSRELRLQLPSRVLERRAPLLRVSALNGAAACRALPG